MIFGAGDALSAMSGGAWHGLIVLIRVAALVALVPAFGERSVPMRIRTAVAVVFALVVAPAVAPIPAPPTLTGQAGMVVTEAVIGLVLGVGLRLFVIALQTAGTMAAQAVSLSQIFGGLAGDPVPAMGGVLVVAGLALAVTAGLHVRAAAFMVASYDLFPAGEVPGAADVAAFGVSRVSRSFALAFSLAAPFVIASAVYNLALGAINRAMPQLMVAFVGAPVLTLGGLVLLAICAPLMLSVWVDALGAYLAVGDARGG